MTYSVMAMVYLKWLIMKLEFCPVFIKRESTCASGVVRGLDLFVDDRFDVSKYHGVLDMEEGTVDECLVVWLADIAWRLFEGKKKGYRVKDLEIMRLRVENKLLRDPIASVLVNGATLSGKGFDSIYFLCSRSEVVYIGKTGKVYRRIKDHERGSKEFMVYFHISVPAGEDVLGLEKRCIKLFQPRLNVVHNGGI